MSVTTQTQDATREAWLKDLASRMNETLFDGALTNYRVTCGWPCRSPKKVIGQCFSPAQSQDGHTEIFLSPMIADPMRAAGILAHEMVHGIVGVDKGHGAPFKALATRIGLEGKMTATTEGEAFKQVVQPILDAMPAYPHAALSLPEGKKQTTRMIKASCEDCDYIVRLSRKALNSLGAPICPGCGETMHTDS